MYLVIEQRNCASLKESKALREMSKKLEFVSYLQKSYMILLKLECPKRDDFSTCFSNFFAF